MKVRRRALRAALVSGSVGMLAIAMWAPAADAGLQIQPFAEITVAKTVSGPVPEGTTFTASLECDDDIIIDGNDFTDSVEVTFDATGQPTSPDTFGLDDPGSCTVTETDDGGASSTTYECESVAPVNDEARIEQVEPGCSDAGPVSDPITVNIEVEEQQATMTINNTFVAPTTTTTTVAPAPQAAPAVVAQARFTG